MKNIVISEELHKKLLEFKANRGFKSIDETICYIIDFLPFFNRRKK